MPGPSCSLRQTTPHTVRAARTRRDFLIITADDFGVRESVNEAIELAVRHGVLTAASLMVGGLPLRTQYAAPGACRQLRVGLHIVLVDGAATLERAQIPALVDASGRFGKRMALDGLRFFSRRQRADSCRPRSERSSRHFPRRGCSSITSTRTSTSTFTRPCCASSSTSDGSLACKPFVGRENRCWPTNARPASAERCGVLACCRGST